jgi:hypothetical protein
MPKPKFSSASVDALLKLRDEIEEELSPTGPPCYEKSF